MTHTLDANSPLSLPAPVQASSMPAAMPKPARTSGIKRVFKFLAWSMVIVLIFSAIAATGLMTFAANSIDASAGQMWINGESNNMADIMSKGLGAIVVAWLAVTGGLAIAFWAVVFAGLVVLLSVIFAAGVVALVGLVLAAPALLVLAFVVWVFRKALG